MSPNNCLAKTLNILRDEILTLSDKGYYRGPGYRFGYVIDDICLEFEIYPEPLVPRATINISSENNADYYFSCKVDVLNTVFKQVGSLMFWAGDFHFKVLKQEAEESLILEINKVIDLMKVYDEP